MNNEPVHIKPAVSHSRREKGGTEELHGRSSNERPGRPCSFAALSGRRAAQDGQGTMPGGPERAGAKGSGETLSAGRAAATGQIQRETLGRGRSAARVTATSKVMAGATVLAVAMACLLVSSAAAQTIFVRPGDTLTLPTSIINADDQGNAGGDTISSMQLVVIGDSALVTNATPSATQALAPGEAKTFSPSFVVGNVPDGTYSVTLHMVSTDAGIDPDPDSAASDTVVSFTRSSPSAVVERVV